MPPDNPPSLLLTTPPRFPTIPYPNHPATTTATDTSAAASLRDTCCCVPQRGCLSAEKGACLRRRAIIVRIYCQKHTHTKTHTHTHTRAQTHIQTYITHIGG
jgi:hypothetical protein